MRIQKLSDEQLKAFEDATYIGITPRVEWECEHRRQLISELVDKLAELTKQARTDVSSRAPESKKAA